MNRIHMKAHDRLMRIWIQLLAGGALVFGDVIANGQPGPTGPKTEEVIVMSPFVVKADSDIGYAGTETLAGTGLNSKITDLGSSISVVTSKFMQDTASFSMKELLISQSNMEATGFGGNLSGATPTLGGTTGVSTLSNAETGTRVRGLAAATTARNFYRSIIPMDAYNTERIDINRGADALLFGVGSPAGIINTSTSRANLNKSFGTIDIVGGSYGSWRTSFNINDAILSNQLAVRVAWVKDEENFQQKFAYNNSDRKYAAIAWDIKQLRNLGILTSTTIRANYEQGTIISNNPDVLTPVDQISSWFDASLPPAIAALGVKGKVGYDPTTGPFNVFSPANGNENIGVTTNINRSPVFIFQSPTATSPVDNIPSNAAGQTILGQPFVSNNVYFPTSKLTGTAVGASSRSTIRILTDYGFPNAGFYTGLNLSDPSVFDFFNNKLTGPNSVTVSNLKAANASLEQLLGHGTAGIELSYDKQNWDESQQSLFFQTSPIIAIDADTTMWFNGQPNPGFGRPFVAGAGNGASWIAQQVETERAKAFYSLDLARMLDGWIGRILGKHIFSVLAQREIQQSDNRTGGAMFYTPVQWTNGSTQSRNGGAGGKMIEAWVYLGPSMANANSPTGAHLSGIQTNLMNLEDMVNGRGVVVSRVPAPSAAVATQAAYAPSYTSLNIYREDPQVDNTAAAATLSQATLDSRAFAIQSNWLWDQVITTVGWRREQSSAISVNAPIDPFGEGYALVHDPSYSLYNPKLVPQVFAETLFAKSVVAKAPGSWLKHIPVISELNVYYGSSENFAPPASRVVNCFGVELPPPGGKTTEQGIYLEAFHGRVSFRLDFFKTLQVGSYNDAVGGLTSQLLSDHQAVWTMVHSGYLSDAGNGFPAHYVAPPQALLDLFKWQVNNGTPSYTNPGVTDTNDFVSKGTEFEFMMRPTRGLSIILNAAEQKSVRSNTGAALGRLLFSTPTSTGKPIATEWQSDWAYQIPLNVGALSKIGDRSDQSILANAFRYFILNPYNSALAADGTVAQDLRKWRANFTGNYDFQGRRLKGFGVGVSARWLDKVAIGYPVITTPSGISVSDASHPYYGPPETYYDGWISYRTKVLKEKVDMKVQLNVKNMFTHNKLIPVFANPDGTVAVWQIDESRKFTVSTTFSF